MSQLPEHLRDTVKLDQETIDALTASLDPLLPNGETPTDGQINDIMAFLFSMTSPSADLMLDITPDEVLSGLEVDRLPPSQIGVLYDPATGNLELIGEAGIMVDSLFLRINDGEAGDPAGFSFAVGSAPWSGDEEIVLSDEGDAQSFLDYRSSPIFLFQAGDELQSLLPAGLSTGDVAKHLTAAYRKLGLA